MIRATLPGRRLIWLDDSSDWRGRLAGLRAAVLQTCDCWWYGQAISDDYVSIARPELYRYFGSECSLLVIDARVRLDADALGALSGALVAGGILVLLMSESVVSSRFMQRFQRVIARSAPRLAEVPPYIPANTDPAAVTVDQGVAINAILRVAAGHRRRPLVITADRGRGKTSALGIAAARLLQSGARNILVTAPSRAAVAPLFDQLKGLLGDVDPTCVRYVPAAELADNPLPADLVLVDEAAAIPVAVLEILLRCHARIVFATTVHGYEGTGRGFAIRFKRVLDEVTPQWRQCEMSSPIRWAPNDPLEAMLFDALLLDAQAAEETAIASLRLDECEVARFSQDQLTDEEGRLRETFGLLINAHYQTRPSDLQRMLDDPSLHVWLALYTGHVVAAALVVYEGGFDQSLAAAISVGERRPAGHLLAQTLATHAGFPAAASARYARIMRIATHPAVQRRGIGARLLAAVNVAVIEDGLDFVGTSFGATADLLGFWRGAGFAPVRVGLRRDPASGTHSVVWLRPLVAAAQQLMSALRDRYFDQLPYLLADGLEDLEPDLVVGLASGAPSSPITADDFSLLTRFGAGELRYATALPSLWRLVWSTCAEGSLVALDGDQRRALIGRLLQKQDWPEVVRVVGVPGRAQLELLLRNAVNQLLQRR